MKNIIITNLEPHDWRSYKQLRLAALKDSPQAYATSYADTLKHPDKYWIELLQDAEKKEHEWLVFAKNNQQLIGMVGAWCPDKTDVANVVAVYVIPEFRGHGLSKLLMAELLKQIKANQQIKIIKVEVNPTQTAALKLYQLLGFKTVSRKIQILGDGLTHDVWEMVIK